MSQHIWDEGLERELVRIVLEGESIERQNLERRKKLPPEVREAIERGERLLSEAQRERSNTEGVAGQSSSHLPKQGGIAREKEKTSK